MPARQCRHLYSRFEFANVCLLYVHTHSHTAVTPDHRAVMCLAVIFLSHYCRLKECLIMLCLLITVATYTAIQSLLMKSAVFAWTRSYGSVLITEVSFNWLPSSSPVTTG